MERHTERRKGTIKRTMNDTRKQRPNEKLKQMENTNSNILREKRNKKKRKRKQREQDLKKAKKEEK